MEPCLAGAPPLRGRVLRAGGRKGFPRGTGPEEVDVPIDDADEVTLKIANGEDEKREGKKGRVA
jgi:hypothetical protein